MKKTITLIAAALMLCCMAQAQVSFLQANDQGNHSGTSWTTSWTAPTGTTSMAFCLSGDVITGGHDDITGVTYNGTALTQVNKFTGPDDSSHNMRYLYLYKLNSPTTGSSQNIVVSATNSHFLAAVVAAYGGSTDIAGNITVNGPTSTSPWSDSQYMTAGGSTLLVCDGVSGTHGMTAGQNLVSRVVQGSNGTPVILDTNGGVNPPSSLTVTGTFTPSNGNDANITAEILPSTTQFGVLQNTYSATNSWVYNASDSGMGSCDYEGQAWDTTTSPYTDITSSATFSCDGSYNVTAAFTGSKTGVMLIVPNPIKCSTNTAPCTGTPPTSTHGIIGLPPKPVYADNTSVKSSGQFSNTASWTHTISSTCSNPYLIVAITGLLAPNSTSITSATYNGNAMTQLYSVDSAGSAINGDPIMWVYGYANPATGSHTVSVTVSSGDNLNTTAVDYCNVNDIIADETTPHNEMFGPFTASPQDEVVYPLESGSMSLLITQTEGTSADTSTVTTLRKNNGGGPPAIYDTKTATNPGFHFNMGLDFNPNFMTLFYQIIHLRPAPPLYWARVQSSAFSSSNSWVFHATDSGMTSCDYHASAWDTTTSPYTDLTSLATFSCDGSNNITAAFSANQSGKIVVVPNSSNTP